MKIKMWLQKVRESYDWWCEKRKLRKLSKAIWKYGLSDSKDPVYTKKDAYTIAIGIAWNDADEIKKVLSYTDEFGNRNFPR